MSSKTARLEQSVIDRILKLTKPGDLILEFGSGESTRQLAAAGRLVIAIEHDQRYIKPTVGVTFIHAPIVGKWYDRQIVSNTITGRRFDLVLIDGPKGYGQTDRLGMLDFIESIQSKLIVVDDVNRPQEKRIADSIKGSKRLIGRACFCEPP